MLNNRQTMLSWFALNTSEWKLECQSKRPKIKYARIAFTQWSNQPSVHAFNLTNSTWHFDLKIEDVQSTKLSHSVGIEMWFFENNKHLYGVSRYQKLSWISYNLSGSHLWQVVFNPNKSFIKLKRKQFGIMAKERITHYESIMKQFPILNGHKKRWNAFTTAWCRKYSIILI